MPLLHGHARYINGCASLIGSGPRPAVIFQTKRSRVVDAPIRPNARMPTSLFILLSICRRRAGVVGGCVASSALFADLFPPCGDLFQHVAGCRHGGG